MTEQEKIERLIIPEKFFPNDIGFGNLRGNKGFIKAFLSQLEVLRESQYWPVSLLENIQLKSLENFFKNIARKSDFWRDYLENRGLQLHNLTSLIQLRTLPVIKRENLTEWGEKVFIIDEDNSSQRISEQHTSGTGGLPLKLLWRERESAITLPYLFRHPAFDKILLDPILSRKFVVSIGRPGSIRYSLGDFIYYAFPFTSPYEMEDEALRKSIYKKIREASPAMLIGHASLLLRFAEYVAKDSIELPLLAVRLSSEPILKSERVFIDKTLDAPIINTINCNEVGAIGFECKDNMDSFHLNAERLILEVINNDGSALNKGEKGDLTVTVPGLTMNPMIRYMIGDRGSLLERGCRCSRNLPLFSFEGRTGENLILPSGRKIRSVFLRRQLAEHRSEYRLSRNTKQFQIQQIASDKIIVRIILKDNTFDDSYETFLRLALTGLFNGERVMIDFEYLDKISSDSSGKPRFFIPLDHSESRNT